MMRILLCSVLFASLAGLLAGQDPKPAVVTGAQVPAKPQDPVQKVVPPAGSQDPKPQEPKKQDPKQGGTKETAEPPKPGEQKPGEQKTGEQKTGEPTRQDPKTGETTEVELPDDVPLPPGATAEDLRAMKSAQEMLVAERRLRARIKAGQIKDIDKLLSFEELTSWPYEDGLKGMPNAVRDLDGKQVVMIGFMLPIDEVEDIKEFLLVQSLWACCYGQPPDINGIVRVVMKGDRRCDYQFDPILVKGRFKVEATLEDGYCIDIFQLHATEVSLLK
jgi:hypothetical protein